MTIQCTFELYAVPAPSDAKDDWNTSNTATTVNITITGTMLMLDLSPVEASPGTPSITDADLALLAGEAARRWVLAGVDPNEAQRALAGTTFVIDDLPGSVLGMQWDNTIVIDVNAAGYGWFVDASPASDGEFGIVVAPSEFQAGRGSGAYGRADLLTAMMHEFGHALGMAHLEGAEFEHSVMHDTIGLSTRRIPTAADILASDEFFAQLAASGSTVKRRRW